MGNSTKQNHTSTDTQIAKLALLGETVSLFGQAITTLAAYMALEAEEQEDETTSHIQEQINYLLKEVEQLKK